MKNTYAFDLGIPGWAVQHPEETLLLGAPLSESKVKFIPKSEFKKRCLSWDEFREKAKAPGVKIIDSREGVQKGLLAEELKDSLSDDEAKQLELFNASNQKMLADLNDGAVVSQTFDMISRFILPNKRYRQTPLLVFDQVGKQVRWLMYHLEKAGFTNYYFLDKGATGVIGIQAYGKK